MGFERIRLAFPEWAVSNKNSIGSNAKASAPDNPAPTPVQSPFVGDDCRALSPDRHAEALLSWLRASDVHGVIRSADLRRYYEAMARRQKWRPRAWNPVAHKLTGLLGGRKTYRWLKTSDGEYRRLRVYEISIGASSISAAPDR